MRNNGEFIMPRSRRERWKEFWSEIKKQPALQLMAMVGVVFLFIFNYVPMFGLAFAFFDVDGSVDIMGSFSNMDWVGLSYFKEFVTDENFLNIILNTTCISLLQLIVNFPMSLIFALVLSEVKNRNIKSGIECVSFFPNFVSWIAYGAIVCAMLSSDGGVINGILQQLGIIDKSIHFIETPAYFWAIAVISNLCKNLGWGSVIYLSAISQIDPCLYDAARIDGATRFQRILHITLPSIIIVLFVNLVFQLSQMLNSDFAQIWMLQRTMNLSRSEVLDIYIAKVGFNQMRYSYVTAAGLFKSVIGTVLLVGGNKVCSKFLGRRLF